MTNLVFRPLFALLTLALLVVAFFQVSGRLMFHLLDDLEGGINRWLVTQGVSVHGLSGSWLRLNPVVHAERIDLGAGHLGGVRVELDWLESLVRNRLVARRISVDEGRLLLERTAAGWRLAGGGDGSGVDLDAALDTLYESDALETSLRLGFIDKSGTADPADDLLVRYVASNRAARHNHRLSVANADCPDQCAVAVAFDESEALPLLRPRVARLKLSGGNLRLPAPLLGAAGGRLELADGHWWLRDSVSGGRGSMEVRGLAAAGAAPIDGRFELEASGEDGRQHMLLSGLELSSGTARWQLPAVLLTYEDGLLKAWTERLDAREGFQFVAALAPRDSAVYRWLDALSVQATALNVHAYLRVPELEAGYLATLTDVSLDGYNGAPWIRGGAGELIGVGRLLTLNLNASNLGVQFPEVFHQRWTMDQLSGRLQAFISGDYFGLRGTSLKARLGDTHASGGFAVSRPQDRYRERLTLLINVDRTTVAAGKQYIPFRLPAGLPEWLDAGPRAGSLEDVALAYHGQVHTRPFELARRVDFVANISQGEVQYHPDWPLVTDLSGRIGVAGRDVRIRVDEGLSLGQTDLSGSRIRLRDDAAFADIDLVSSSTVEQALAFIRSTPLAGWLTFVTPDWSGTGALAMNGRLYVPLKLMGEHIGEQAPADELQVDLDIELAGADLDLPGYGVELAELTGTTHYTYPYGISGENVRGRMFGRPARFSADSDEDTVLFHVDGQAPYEDLLALLDVADPGVMRGAVGFAADLHIELGEAVSRLEVTSDLTGLALDLPAGFDKAPDDAVATELELRFLDDYQSARFRYGDARGWLHVDGVPLRGAIGFGAPPPLVEGNANGIVLGGRISGFRLDQVIPQGEGGPGLALPLELRGLEVGLIDVNGVSFRDATLSGRIVPGSDGAEFDLAVISPDLSGSLARHPDAPLTVDLARLRLPGGVEAEAGAEDLDPLSVDVIPELVDADVTLREFRVGDADYGFWSFGLRTTPTGVTLKDLRAELRGLTISAPELYWDGPSNRTRFAGTLKADDLATVLPQWGYAPSVTTRQATMEADVAWNGSPALVELDRLVGRAVFAADDGRFVEVTSGADAMKIFSLVNFSTIVKRLNFDFSDVVGEGVSFDTLTATTDFDAGRMRFVEPMTVRGSGSSFRIAGTVDLMSGQLSNEMIVTLPVTKGLPWYAAYVALANPLAGVGWLVGERLLRKPLEQFSSAKYEISGTLEEPELKFVSVWDTRMDQPQVTLEQPDPEALDVEGPVTPVPEVPVDEADTPDEVSQHMESTTG